MPHMTIYSIQAQKNKQKIIIAHYEYIHATFDKTYNIMSVRFQLKDENQIEKNI